MKALFFALLRTSIVIFIGLTTSAAVTIWFFSGKFPRNSAEISAGISNLIKPPQKLVQLQTRDLKDVDKINDDSETEAVSSTHHPHVNADSKKYEEALHTLTTQIENQQKQLDRIENQNHVLTSQLNDLLDKQKK